ncbi:MAG: S8 family serine peptidase, partial [Actinomycetota bacterium]|nr:S8 family serine peptidase [Actinomycetota bacterium]
SGAGVTVGVIDGEVALGHPGLLDRVIHRRNYTREPFGVPGAHGTAVAGIVAGDTAGYEGVAPKATIYNYKVLASTRELNGDDFGGALAIQHALEDGLRVVNCSWGAGRAKDGKSREAVACNTAWRFGLTIVKSAGNQGPGVATITTPADAEGVLVVGAANRDGTKLADYSSRGPTADQRHRPHVLAPGGDWGDELHGLLVGGAVGEIGVGTSYAAPHVAGLVALLLEREPELTPSQQRDLIVAAAQALDGLSVDEQGAGVVQADRLFADGG